MYRTGTISDRQPEKGLYRVKFDEDDMVSGWLHLTVKKTFKDSSTHALDINEHVACLVDENCENGCIVGAIYSTADQPKNATGDTEATTFSDGTTVIYDRSSHTLTVNVKGGNIQITTTDEVSVDCKNATVKAAVAAKVDTPEAEFTGNVKVDGNLVIGGNMNGGGNLSLSGDSQIAGRLNVTQQITGDADIRAGGGAVGLLTHTHAVAGAVGTPSPGLG